MINLHGLSVLITGGGSGIGEATARLLAERGAKVTISGRRAEKVDPVAADIGCRAVVGDVTVSADRERMIQAALEYGGKLDVLFNNAGNMLRGPIESISADELSAVFDSNVL